MTILKTDTTRTGQRLIGTYVGQKIHSYMALQCVAKGTTKSKIFSALLLEWMSKQKEKESDAKLIALIVKRTQDVLNKQRKKGEVDTDVFREGIEDELLQKGIPLDYVGQILSGIE